MGRKKGEIPRCVNCYKRKRCRLAGDPWDLKAVKYIKQFNSFAICPRIQKILDRPYGKDYGQTATGVYEAQYFERRINFPFLSRKQNMCLHLSLLGGYGDCDTWIGPMTVKQISILYKLDEQNIKSYIKRAKKRILTMGIRYQPEPESPEFFMMLHISREIKARQENQILAKL